MAVGLIIGAATLVAGVVSSMSSAKNAKSLSRTQARLERFTADEEVRRMDRDFAELKGKALASIGASNIHQEGSAKDIMRDMESEYMRQRQWTEYSAYLRAKVAKAGGNSAARQIQGQGIQSGLQGVQQMGQSQGWWT